MSGEFHEGRCACGASRFRMAGPPIFVHACHCRECQRLTGGPFALNAIVEADRVTLLSGPLESVPVPGTSGRHQTILRCRDCKVALWSHYPGAGPKICFVRVGTLDEPGRIAPDIHIFTSSKLPWLPLPEDVPSVLEYYSPRETWPAESRARWKAARES